MAWTYTLCRVVLVSAKPESWPRAEPYVPRIIPNLLESLLTWKLACVPS